MTPARVMTDSGAMAGLLGALVTSRSDFEALFTETGEHPPDPNRNLCRGHGLDVSARPREFPSRTQAAMNRLHDDWFRDRAHDPPSTKTRSTPTSVMVMKGKRCDSSATTSSLPISRSARIQISNAVALS